MSSLIRAAVVLTLSIGLPSPVSAQALRATDSSQVVVLSLTSQVFGNTRAIRVYLPRGYNASDSAHGYPTFYFNDGFAVFSPRLWKAPRTLDSLIDAKIIPPLIVVGVDNAASIPGVANPGQARANEYLPYPDATEPDLPIPQGQKYPAFIIDEVMPLIARSFHVLDGPANTGIGGSSYGGIAALATVLRSPGRFGMLLLESTPLFLFKERLIDESKALTTWPTAIYVGIGTREATDLSVVASGDKALQRFVQLANEQSPLSRVTLNVVEGGTHTAAAWGARLPTALSFLFRTS